MYRDHRTASNNVGGAILHRVVPFISIAGSPRATIPNRNSDDMKPRQVLYEHNLEKSAYKYSFIENEIETFQERSLYLSLSLDFLSFINYILRSLRNLRNLQSQLSYVDNLFTKSNFIYLLLFPIYCSLYY